MAEIDNEIDSTGFQFIQKSKDHSKNKGETLVTDQKARSLVIKSLYFPNRGNNLHQAIQRSIANEFVMFYSPDETQAQQNLQKQMKLFRKELKLEQINENNTEKQSILFPKQKNENEQHIYEDKGVELVEKIKRDIAYSSFDYRIYEEVKEMRKELKQEKAMRNLTKIMLQQEKQERKGNDDEEDNQSDNNFNEIDEEEDDEFSMSVSDMMHDREDYDFYDDHMRDFYQRDGYYDDKMDGHNDQFEEENDDELQNQYYRQKDKQLEDEQIEQILESQKQKANQRTDEEEKKMIYHKQSLDYSEDIGQIKHIL